MTNWSLRRGNRSVRFRLERLAPGLTRYVPRRTVRGVWDLTGTKSKLRFAKGTRATIPAPRVRAVNMYQRPFRRRYGGMATSTHVFASVKGGVPTNVIGVIVYLRGRKLVPMLFQRVGAATLPSNKKGTIQLYASPGRCQTNVPGLRLPNAGARVQLRWVDAFGRLSPLSKPVVIKNLGTI